ncbi:MAG TPA: GNAT family N-acetyltransferase [Acidimicrobiia bacterium]|nr:GNAT family N-acetyltransferase [Acidimicrobiia bacterium]
MPDTATTKELTAVEVVDPCTDARWASLAERHGSLFNSPPWLRALRTTYDFDLSALLVTRGPQTVAGLPLARLPNPERFSVLPFSDFCNPIDPSGGGWQLLAGHLDEARLPIELRYLGESEGIVGASLTEVGHALWHGIDVEPDETAAFASLASSARRAIRKARNAGLEVRAGSDRSTVRAFYALHLGTRKRKYRLLPQPLEFFENLLDEFGERLVVLGAWRGDEMVAGVLYIEWGDTLYYKFNASAADVLELRPNDLLMWEGTRLAAARGLTLVDLGRTDADHDSLARYKEKYATRLGRIATLRSPGFGRDPLIGSTLGPLTELFTRDEIPDDITAEAATYMYRHFA